MTLTKTLTATFILSAILATAACGGPDAGADSARIRIAVTGTTNSSNIPLFAAMASGELTDDLPGGAEVELVPMASGNDLMTALKAGEVEMCVCNSFQVLKAASAGDDIVSIFEMYNGAGFVYAGKGDAADGDFEDTVFGYTREGSSGQAYGNRLLEELGVPADSVTGVALGSQDAFLPALEAERVDWIAMDTFSASVASEEGIASVVHNSNDIADYGPVAGHLLGNGVVAQRSYIDGHSELVQAVVDGLVAALSDVQGKGADADSVLAMMTEDFRDGRAERPAAWPVEWRLVAPAFDANDGMFSETELADTSAFGIQTGALTEDESEKVDLAKVFDSAYVQKAYDTLDLTPVDEAR